MSMCYIEDAMNICLVSLVVCRVLYVYCLLPCPALSLLKFVNNILTVSEKSSIIC